MTSALPSDLLQTGRTIHGCSAVLMPFDSSGTPDFAAFRTHLSRTAEAGLVSAVNMDTGYVAALSPSARAEVLALTQAELGGRPFIAGAFVGDRPSDAFDLDRYAREATAIAERGGTPILFQSYGLTRLPTAEIAPAYAAIGRRVGTFLAFELGTMFADFGRIYDLETFAALLTIPECVGLKHSSLDRELEWQRLRLRNRARPDFRLYTGNDLAIDMVMYGSDYLLGLSTFAPEAFARRDALWAASDPAFFALNDLLQYLGYFAFRAPVPAYRHSAAQFLKCRGVLASDATPPGCPRRPDSDVAILAGIVRRLEALT